MQKENFIRDDQGYHFMTITIWLMTRPHNPAGNRAGKPAHAAIFL